MPNNRLQLKLMAILAALVVVVVVVTGTLAERGQRARMTEILEARMTEEARLVRELVAGVPFGPESSARLDAIADRAAKAAQVRITFIAGDGRVLGDSDIPFENLHHIESHATRPEVVAAISGQVGHGTRLSDTVKRGLLYIAIPVDPARPTSGVVRVAQNLDALDAAAARLRGELLLAGLAGLAAALGLSYVLSSLSLRPIRELQTVIADIASGQLDRRLLWNAKDERREIAGAVNGLARQLGERAEEAVRRKERLEAVLASMVEGVLVLDEEGHVVLANPRIRELLSMRRDVEGRSVPEVVREPEIDAVISEARSASEPVVRELQVENGSRRILLVHASGFPESGPRAGTVAVIHDVTELRRVDRVRRDFIANASHELRTPLTSIQGFADTLNTSELSQEEMQPYLEVILRNAQRMSTLIDDLLELSRIEGDGGSLVFGEVDVVRLTRTLLADFAPRFAEAQLDASMNAVGTAAVWGDRRAVEQVVSNLLSNAVRYTNAGGRIEVRIDGDDDEVRICVEDTGVGIPERSLERIFERFYRVDSSRSMAVGSTGLGLAIVKHLVRAMRGEISVKSEVGKGSCFTVTLPALHPEQKV